MMPVGRVEADFGLGVRLLEVVFDVEFDEIGIGGRSSPSPM